MVEVEMAQGERVEAVMEEERAGVEMAEGEMEEEERVAERVVEEKVVVKAEEATEVDQAEAEMAEGAMVAATVEMAATAERAVMKAEHSSSASTPAPSRKYILDQRNSSRIARALDSDKPQGLEKTSSP